VDRREPLSISGTVAGRAFSATTILESPRRPGRDRRFWVPLLDGTDRLGVMGMTFGPDDVREEMIATCERYAHLAALLIITKGAYGDVFEIIRRQRGVTIASELLWALTPPLVFATDRLLLAGMLEPCYDHGGDALDYALNDDILHLAVFDAMGHGLTAAGMAAFAISAYRHCRRQRCDLVQTYETMDAAVSDQFPDERFVTALMGRLNLTTGELTWISAGHPPPLLIRAGHAHTVPAAPATPLGVPLATDTPQVAHETLEPGDFLLFYTDGLSEARSSNGARFTSNELSEFIERQATTGHTAPEVLRRLRSAIVTQQDGQLEDDASAILLQWNRAGELAILPPTVP
jgi:hypothetical protein